MTLVLNGSDTSAGDDAGLGYTSAEGIIITGQGSTSDVTIKNDADATVINIPTGTTKVGIGHATAASTLDVLLAGNGNISGPTSGVWAARVVNEQDSDTYNGLAIQNRWAADSSFILEGAMGWNGSSTGYFPVFTIDGLGQAIFKPQRAEAMRITSDGKVGIGTAAPTGQFAVSDGTRIGEINPHSSGTFIGNRSNHNVLFQVNAAEKMRIDTGGQTMIGTTSFNTGTGHSFHPDGYYYLRRASGAAQTMMLFYNDGNAVGEIRTSTTATQFLTSSDYRLKENVDYSWDATARLKQLKPARFNFISDPDVTIDGFIAHEAQEVVPHAVTGKKDAEEMQAIDQSKLVPLLVKAMQEQQTVIEALEARITALEGS